MLDSESVQLIEGKFIPEQAKEVLFDLIKSKIEYHKRHKLRGDIIYSEVRIVELESLLIIVENVTRQAELKNKKIILFGNIHLKLVD